GFDLDLLRVADLIAVLVEEPLVRDPNGDGDRARAFRPHTDPDWDDLTHADLRDWGDALRLDVAGAPDLPVPSRQFPTVLALEEVGLAGFLQGCAGIGESALEAVDVAVLDRLPGSLQVRPRSLRRDSKALRLRDELLEALDLVHRPPDDLMPFRIQESLLQVALEPVHFLEIVRSGRILGVRAVFVEFLLVEAEGHAFLDHR